MQQGHLTGTPGQRRLEPVARYVEDLTPCVYLEEFGTTPVFPDAEGYLNVPDRPGLGIELNREALKRFGG
jgi:L-alanine-DL-glutamate epimerase-like enolase superfamily enzyme